MNNGIRRDIICRAHCIFYKPGKKEDLKCGTYDFLSRNLSKGELRRAAPRKGRRPDFSHDREVMKLACERCEFLVGGCDFREGNVSPPCGGYVIIERLLKSKCFI